MMSGNSTPLSSSSPVTPVISSPSVVVNNQQQQISSSSPPNRFRDPTSVTNYCFSGDNNNNNIAESLALKTGSSASIASTSTGSKFGVISTTTTGAAPATTTMVNQQQQQEQATPPQHHQQQQQQQNINTSNNNNSNSNNFQTPLVSSLTSHQNNPRIALQRQAVEALNDLLTSEHQHRHCTCCCLAATKEFATYLIDLSTQQQQRKKNSTSIPQQQQQDEDFLCVNLPYHFKPKTCTCRVSGSAAKATAHSNKNNVEDDSSSATTSTSAVDFALNPKCCSTVINFLTSPNYLSDAVREKLGRALLQFSQSRSVEHPKAKFSCRYTLAVLISGLAQEFFAFWEELPPGIRTVSLSDQPKVVGIGGDKGSVVFEIDVVKEQQQEEGDESETDGLYGSQQGSSYLTSATSPNTDLLTTMITRTSPTNRGSSSSRPQSLTSSFAAVKKSPSEKVTRFRAASSSSPYGGSVVPPSHLKQTERFCVKVTRYSHHGLRTPKKGISRVSSNGKLDSSDHHRTQHQEEEQDGHHNENDEHSFLSTDNTTIPSNNNNNNNQHHQNYFDASANSNSTSTQERQFYGLIKSAATLHSSQKVSNRLLVPFASLDPSRFGKILDAPSVAQCLLLEQWDGDLRWAKESFAKIEKKNNNSNGDENKNNNNNNQEPEFDSGGSLNNDQQQQCATTANTSELPSFNSNSNMLLNQTSSARKSATTSGSNSMKNIIVTGFDAHLEEMNYNNNTNQTAKSGMLLTSSNTGSNAGSRSGSASHQIGKNGSGSGGGLVAFSNFERATANARRQTSKGSFPLNPSPELNSNNNNNIKKSPKSSPSASNQPQFTASAGKTSIASASSASTNASSSTTTKAAAPQQTKKPIFVPSFLKKFAKVDSTNNNNNNNTNKNSNDQKTSTDKRKDNDEKEKEKEKNNTKNEKQTAEKITKEATSTSTTNLLQQLQSPESLHETLQIFHTNKRFIPVIDFDSLGCFAFQLFSALHLMHDELPHLTVVPSNNNNTFSSANQQLLLSPSSVCSSTTSSPNKNGNNNNNNNTQQQQVLICSGYVHNDLHSGNILVRVDDQRICLCDFEHVSDVVVATTTTMTTNINKNNNGSSSCDENKLQGENDNYNLNNNNNNNDKNSSGSLMMNSLLDVVASSASSPFRITPRAYTPPELVSSPKRDVWAATLIVFEMFLGICPLVNALQAGNDMSDCYLTVHEEFGLDWRHFAQLLKEYDSSSSSSSDDDNNEQRQQQQLQKENNKTTNEHDDCKINSTLNNRNHKKEFLDFCSKGLTNNPLNRATAKQMLCHPFLAKKTEKEWEKSIRKSSPYWKQQ